MKKILTYSLLGTVVLIIAAVTWIYQFPDTSKSAVATSTISKQTQAAVIDSSSSSAIPDKVDSPKRVTDIFSGRILESVGHVGLGDQYKVAITNDSGVATVGGATGIVIVNNLETTKTLSVSDSVEYNFYARYNPVQKWYDLIKFGAYIND